VWSWHLFWNCQWSCRLNDLGSPSREVPVFPRTTECLLGTVGAPWEVLYVSEARFALDGAVRRSKSLQLPANKFCYKAWSCEGRISWGEKSKGTFHGLCILWDTLSLDIFTARSPSHLNISPVWCNPACRGFKTTEELGKSMLSPLVQCLLKCERNSMNASTSSSRILKKSWAWQIV